MKAWIVLGALSIILISGCVAAPREAGPSIGAATQARGAESWRCDVGLNIRFEIPPLAPIPIARDR